MQLQNCSPNTSHAFASFYPSAQLEQIDNWRQPDHFCHREEKWLLFIRERKKKKAIGIQLLHPRNQNFLTLTNKSMTADTIRRLRKIKTWFLPSRPAESKALEALTWVMDCHKEETSADHSPKVREKTGKPRLCQFWLCPLTASCSRSPVVLTDVRAVRVFTVRV